VRILKVMTAVRVALMSMATGDYVKSAFAICELRLGFGVGPGSGECREGMERRSSIFAGGRRGV